MNDTVRIENLQLSWKHETIIEQANLTISPGQMVLIRGNSGEGKSTILNMIAGLIIPSGGQVYWGDSALYNQQKKHKWVDKNRSEWVGYVFQDHWIAGYLSGWENICLASKLSKRELDEDLLKEMSSVLFERDFLKVESNTQLKHVLERYAKTMSRGERERVTILRAFVTKPRFILADEMLNSVDPELKKTLWPFIKEICRKHKIGLIMVSHERDILEDDDFDQRYHLKNKHLEAF